jgi:hypothetical protein
MQIVGTSLGIFGPDLLDPELALSSETPLRNALFDALLSLVEGGALDMRPTDDGLYAFRWRPDYAVAGLSPETLTSIDIDAPSPYMAELVQLRRERDDALGRAEFAEALAQERERLLRLADVPVPATRAARSRAPRQAIDALDEREQSILDVLYASRQPNAAPDEIDIRDDEVEIAAIDLVSIEIETVEVEAVEVVAKSRAAKPDAPARATKPRAKPKAAAAKPAKPKAAAAKATKPSTAKATKATKTTRPKATEPKAAESDSSDVVYLTPPAPDTQSDNGAGDEHEQTDDESKPRRAKWSGYTLDKPRMHLSSVDQIADEG